MLLEKKVNFIHCSSKFKFQFYRFFKEKFLIRFQLQISEKVKRAIILKEL
jgi:hypothetical protein